MFEATEIASHVFLFLILYFEVFLLLTFLEGKRARKAARESKETRYPLVSIIVPAFNEEKTIGRTIESLLRLEYPSEKLEIIVVDDGSTDATWEQLNRFRENKNISLIRKEKNGGKHTALNEGLVHARGELIGCLDADSFVDPQALLEIIRRFQDTSIMAVTPAVKVYEPKTILERIQKTEYHLSIFFRSIQGMLDSIFVTPGPFSFFRRSVFEIVGPYKEAHHTEDLEMALRMHCNKLRIANAEHAYVYTTAPKTVYGLYRQRLRWTRGFLKNMIDYRFLLFRREFGNLGILVLPFLLFSLVSALYFFTLSVIRVADWIGKKVVEIKTVGFSVPQWEFDWFFLNTQSLFILVLTLIGVTLLFISFGKKLSSEKVWSYDVFYYLFLYGLLAPWWLSRAIIDTVLSRRETWH